MGPTPDERLRIYVGRLFRATDVHVAEDEDLKVLRAHTANVTTIKPYWHNAAWVFDDPVRGWWAKPFQGRSAEMVDQMLRQARLPLKQSFVIAFADRDWPGVGYRLVLEWARENSGGHWYRWSGTEALYPALVQYFDAPPKQIYCHITARTTLSSIFRR